MTYSVLVVDDEKDIRDILKSEFEFHGFLVQEAENGSQGLKVYKSFPTDVIVSDIRMPIMDGKKFLEQLMLTKSKLPLFYFISGYPDLKPEEAQALGASGLFSKPFQLKELVKHVKEKVKQLEVSK